MAGLIGCLAAGAPAWAAPLLLQVPPEPQNAAEARVGVVALNSSSAPLAVTFPAELPAQLVVGGVSRTLKLQRGATSEPSEVRLEPGQFARRDYQVALPDRPGDSVTLALADFPQQVVTLHLISTTPGEPSSRPTLASTPSTNRPSIKPPPEESEAMKFFRQHFFPHEPLYFLMGWEDPQVKFQISFKYRLFNADEDDPGWAVRKVPQLANLYLGYTQTSLWDTAAESAPFYDTAYKPEFFYQTTRIDQGRWAPWFGMDAQGGFQHASNGQDGPESRSLNVAYVMPTLYFGDVKKFHFRFAPRVYTYIGSLEDNPDIADYYGHVQLRAMVGWADGAQLSVIGTIGDGFNYGSTQLDLTYPLYRFAGGSIAVYLDLQYFTGYGETLLDYNIRSSAFRAGFSLWR